MRDIYHNFNKAHVETKSISADTDGADIDLQGYDSCLIGVYVGVNANYATGDNFALELEDADESTVTPDTAGTYADVAESKLHGAISGTTTGRFALIDDTAEDDTYYFVGYTGGKRYVRIRYEMTGTPSTSTFNAFVMRGPIYKPAS